MATTVGAYSFKYFPCKTPKRIIQQKLIKGIHLTDPLAGFFLSIMYHYVIPFQHKKTPFSNDVFMGVQNNIRLCSGKGANQLLSYDT